MDNFHLDVLGQEIRVGSTVLHGTGSARGNTAGFKPETVTKITPQKINLGGGQKSVWPDCVVVIDKLLEHSETH